MIMAADKGTNSSLYNSTRGLFSSLEFFGQLLRCKLLQELDDIMSLSHHVDPYEIVHHFGGLGISDEQSDEQSQQGHHLTPYSTPYASRRAIPKFEIPRNGAASAKSWRTASSMHDSSRRPSRPRAGMCA
ncbi:hypothetical protein B0T14DRAFT_56834 [Immersiella caudata]|uniref:Uncharacterized protein n=1 Tax=Immersiella caudata TaxID=314043 RepID=A0AA40CCB6_9PEZI|nr:hypothetical protein B0T14DRAFT_56834 [Immersiella caudata]